VSLSGIDWRRAPLRKKLPLSGGFRVRGSPCMYEGVYRGMFGLRLDDDMYTPERHLPTPGQRGHSPQRWLELALGLGCSSG